MYKVLIVDDEPFILEGFKEIIAWKELNLEIAGMAANGMEALQLIEKNPVQILITDVKMPKMNGLELMQAIRERNLNIKCIVCSGYDDFIYVKEAAKLGIENYILKPVDINELTSTLINTESKIDIEMNKKTENRNDINILRDNILYRMVTNDINEDELLERIKFLDINLEFNAFAVAILRMEYDSGDNREICVRSQLKSSARQICEKSVSSSEGIIFNNYEGDIVFIFFDPSSAMDLNRILDKCMENISRTLGMNVFVTVGSILNSRKSLHLSYQQAKNIEDYSLFMPCNKVIFFEEISHSNMAVRQNVPIDFKALNELIHSKKADRCADYIHDLYSTISRTLGLTPSYIQNITIEILLWIISFIRETNPNTDTLFNDLKDLFRTVFQLKSIKETEEWILSILYKSMSFLNEQDQKISPVIRKIMEYINTNYSRDISIRDLSYEFNINPTYLGQLFKNEVGESCTNYLNRIRIGKAKEMLTKTNLKASDISDRIGYTNPNYFFTIFRKITGISPCMYRGNS